MRRVLLIAGGLAIIASLTTAGVASAASAAQSPQIRFKTGAIWTQTNLSNHGCEVETVGANGTFTADRNGDAGTYTLVANHLRETWTKGGDTGQTLKAHWVLADHEFKGLGSGGLGGGTDWGTTLVKGASANC